MTRELNRIVQGDCVAALAKLPAGSVDLVFADPPFNIGYDYDVYNDSKGQKEYLFWSRRWIEGVRRALKPTGTFWLAIGDEYAAELKVLSQEIGFHCRSWVVWYYTFGVNCKSKFSRSHVHLFHFVINPKEYTFNIPPIRVPSARQLVYADSRANPDGRLPDDTWILRPQDCVDGFTPDEDTWYFPRVAGTFKERAGFHGCQMPEQLLGRIIKSCSNPGELVLDPFSGSATTLVVAKKLDRQFLGFELSEDYAHRGTLRLAKVVKGDELEGAAEPLVSAPNTANGKSRATSPRGKRAHGTPETSRNQQVVPKQSVQPKLPASEPSSSRRQTIDDISQSLVEAYLKTHDGFSLDRVVADVELNAQFLDACRKSKIPGQPTDWNRMMFRLRKAGRLAAFPTQRRTQFDWRDCDQFIDASEIAWRQMSNRESLSLDELFCDPGLAAEFDKLAMAFAPGYEPLRYRWAAFMLRKMAKTARQQARSLGKLNFAPPQQVQHLDFDKFDGIPGIYLVTDPRKQTLYVGESFNLGDRFRRNFANPKIKAEWGRITPTPFDQLRIQTMPLSKDAPGLERDLLARQAALVQSRRAMMNATVFSAS